MSDEHKQGNPMLHGQSATFPDGSEQVSAGITSDPASGKYKVLKISVDTETKELVIEAKDTPEP